MPKKKSGQEYEVINITPNLTPEERRKRQQQTVKAFYSVLREMRASK